MITEDICPNCGERLFVKTWDDDRGVVEIYKSCECGYLYHWAYGNVIEDSEREDGDADGE